MQLDFWTFMWRCLDRAATLTAHFFGLDLKTVLTTAGLLGLGFLIHRGVRGATETKEEILKFVILTGAPFFIFLTGLFLFNTFKSPYLIYAEEYGKAKAKIDETTGQKTALEARVAALESRPSTVAPSAISIARPIAPPSQLDLLIASNKNLPKGDRDRFADALFDFSQVLEQANELWGKANQEGAQLSQGWRSGQIARDFEAHKRTLSEIDQSAKLFAKSFPQVRSKWKYFQEQTNYVFGDNPDNEGPNAVINAAEAYSGYLDRWITIPAPNREQRPILDLLEVIQNHFDTYIRNFALWRQGCDRRLSQMKDSIK